MYFDLEFVNFIVLFYILCTIHILGKKKASKFEELT
jgi:hypothetical protein